jgi:HKD family nuclease
MISFIRSQKTTNLPESSLFDEKIFYPAFIEDLLCCKEEIIIESPFITSHRMKTFSPIFKKLVNKGVKIYIITRDPKEHDEEYSMQAEREILNFEIMGIQTLICKGNHHRKLAILDRNILWEGSLNILSQLRSREIMRRIESQDVTMQMFQFLKLDVII